MTAVLAPPARVRARESCGRSRPCSTSWAACRAGARPRSTRSTRDKLLLKGTPACLDQAGIDGIRAQIDAQFPLLGPIVYCDGGAAAPDPVTGLNIPDFKNEASGEVSAARVVTKAGTLAGKCYAKAVTYAFKLGGTLTPDILAKINACIDKAQARVGRGDGEARPDAEASLLPAARDGPGTW